ncbi:MAG TPA: NAD-dependent deacylase [Gemmatimonadaceae bacterium]|nr:NAD-dependent deacylase [Gemmatimonadaceae bacterium]
MPDTVERDSTAAMDLARSLVRDARRVVALTGAGVSAESGVPTFRGAGGLWKQYRSEDLATPQAFARDARLVWEWYGWRRSLVLACAPNAAHRALAGASRTRPEFRVITQNVDGLHAEASGDALPMPLELHGSLFRIRCTACGRRENDRSAIDATTMDTLPHCERCGALMRPDVVWFGESLDSMVLGEAVRLASAADVCLVVGTSALVHPAAGLADLTRRAGGAIVEVNVDNTPITGVAAAVLRGPAAEIVPELLGRE